MLKIKHVLQLQFVVIATNIMPQTEQRILVWNQ